MRKPQLDALLSELKAHLERLYGERFVQLVLYGSHARGDASEHSDVDVMIVLQGEVDRSAEIRRTSHLIAELSLKYDTVISRVIKSEAAFAAQQSPLMLNVHREGVPTPPSLQGGSKQR